MVLMINKMFKRLTRKSQKTRKAWKSGIAGPSLYLMVNKVASVYFLEVAEFGLEVVLLELGIGESHAYAAL